MIILFLVFMSDYNHDSFHVDMKRNKTESI